jgi:hypothetical protein
LNKRKERKEVLVELEMLTAGRSAHLKRISCGGIILLLLYFSSSERKSRPRYIYVVFCEGVVAACGERGDRNPPPHKKHCSLQSWTLHFVMFPLDERVFPGNAWLHCVGVFENRSKLASLLLGTYTLRLEI